MNKVNLSTFNLSLLGILLLFLLNSHAFFSFFSQDDFFHIRQIFNKSWSEILSFFLAKNDLDYAFYRPISRELYNFLVFKIFGLNAFVYHLINLFFIVINGWLLLTFMKEIRGRKQILALSFLVYIISSVHSIELYYLSAIQTLLASFFGLLTLIFYQKFITSKKGNKLFLSSLFFLLALLSHESSITLIPIIFLLELYKNGFKLNLLTKMILKLSPFIFFALIRAFIYLNVKGLPEESVYQPVINLKSIINTLGWYILWSFNFTEILADFIGPGLKLNENFTKWYGFYFYSNFISLTLILLLLSYFLFILRDKIFKDKYIFVFLTGYFVSLTPFIFFPQHKFIYYLTLPIVFFSCMVGYLLDNIWSKKGVVRFAPLLVLSLLLLISYQTSSLNKITYWAAKRASAAEYLLLAIKKEYPLIKDGQVLYLKDDPKYPFIASEWGSSSKQAFYILSGSDAIQLIYNNPGLEVFYEAIDKKPDKDNQVLEFISVFPY